jgi:NADH-quinone oxidoreductase subunit N
MLCAGADDLIWLFLALELTSLPTYIMVSLSTRHGRSMEAGVKYFFLGALGAAIFLYGFTLIYGGTGSTDLGQIHRVLAEQAAAAGSPSGINPIAMAGLVLAVIGVAFKIAAVPMHFYTPDVYQGASASVAAFLAFVPKTAGFLTLMLLCSAVGWTAMAGPADSFGSLPSPLHETLWIMAALTMTVGNVLALIQTSVKRLLAYSSIAHSGYMLVGLVAGPGDGFASSGLAAILFYLISYGVINLGAFAVLASLERTGLDGQPDEIDSFDDLRGLCRSRPLLGYTLVLSSLGLLGLPLTLGFWAKLPLFTAALASGETVLLLILAVNSAIAAYYYLGLARAAWLDSAETTPGAMPPRLTPFLGRIVAGLISAACVIVLAIIGGGLMTKAKDAGAYRQRLASPPSLAPSGGGLTRLGE